MAGDEREAGGCGDERIQEACGAGLPCGTAVALPEQTDELRGWRQAGECVTGAEGGGVGGGGGGREGGGGGAGEGGGGGPGGRAGVGAWRGGVAWAEPAA